MTTKRAARFVVPFLVAASVSLLACGSKNPNGDDGGGDGGPVGSDACVGLECQVPDCSGSAQSSTTIEGYVYAPNGTLPLYGVNVYIPNGDTGTITPGLDGTCDVCGAALPGDPATQAVTDEHGHFLLSNVPDADNIPLVVQTGKWRKQLKLQTRPMKCANNMLPAADTTLPAKMTESGGDIVSVDMPQIAISTGGADALECLIRKLGIADSEITTMGGSGRVHLYSDTQSNGSGASKFNTGFAGGSGNFADSQKLWGSAGSNSDSLAKYDLVMLSCEGGQYPNTKSQNALDSLKTYADDGGRVFLSHWHNIWVSGATQSAGAKQAASWAGSNGSGGVAEFGNSNDNPGNNVVDTIDEMDNPKGMSFAEWMMDPKVAGTPPTETVMDQIPIEDGTAKNTCTSVDNTKAETWVKWNKSATAIYPQNFQFTTPQEMPDDSRCGKVVFSDMHVSGDSKSSASKAYPTQCSSAGLTAQEKALAFMFFDIESCVGPPIGRELPDEPHAVAPVTTNAR